MPTTTALPSTGQTERTPVRQKKLILREQAPNAQFTHDLLTKLDRVGFRAAPRYRGVDYLDREILTFIPGDVPEEQQNWSNMQLVAAAAMIRSYHDATTQLSLRGDQEIVCHGSLSPCNTVFQEGIPNALINFDAAHPGTRLSDLGYGAWTWLNIGKKDVSHPDVAAGIGLFAYVYGDVRADELATEVVRVQAREP